jgi:hypothetical protein
MHDRCWPLPAESPLRHAKAGFMMRIAGVASSHPKLQDRLKKWLPPSGFSQHLKNIPGWI